MSAWSQMTAVFGGTFDPPHRGHREAVAGLFKLPGVKRVIVQPSAIPPFKPGATASEHRLAMTRSNFAGLDDVMIDTRELDRAKLSAEPSYTFNTLQEMRREFPDLAFVIGTDQLLSLPNWYRFPEILNASHWIVLLRKPDGEAVAARVLKDWEASGLVKTQSTTADIKTWKLTPPGAGLGRDTLLAAIPTEAMELASQSIRLSFARDGKAPKNALLPEVEAYIARHKLYT